MHISDKIDFKAKFIKKDRHYKRERQILYYNIHIWNLKYATDKPIYKTETDS